CSDSADAGSAGTSLNGHAPFAAVRSRGRNSTPDGHVLGNAILNGRRSMSAELIIPVIMCGGAGTRLWPVSRESMPKQFVPLIDERSTFQQTLDRIRDEAVFDRPIVIT